MKITSFKLRNFFNDPKIVISTLIYGNDYNKICIYLNKIIKKINVNDEFSLIRLEFAKVNKNPNILLTELATVSMFSKKKIVILTDSGDAISKDLQYVLNNYIGDGYVIVTSYELTSRSMIKLYYENSFNMAVIACYKNDNDNLKDIISEYLCENKIRYTDEVLIYLYQCFCNSGASVYLELEKLLLYIGDKKSIEIQDIENSLFIDLNPMFDDLCSAVADGNISNFVKLADEIHQDRVTSIALIRIIYNYFLRLSQIMLEVKNGVDVNQAIKSFKPPIFFKLIPVVRNQINNIIYTNVVSMLKKLLELEIICKKSEINQYIVFKHYMVLMISSIRKI